ncbi:unnamed protein product [Ceutorhynchus assimilis]|uniref:Uncharacterized protein n=1 Tax=Ceutorhynchus assimilis TaxID=467358 RepID=A0A9N9MLK9_9CUCU|nr:unnamed protein product [Ceutorhynchus assimilis]
MRQKFQHNNMTKYAKAFVLILIVLAITCQETEARRKIVRGRKVVNRTYLKPLGIPAWAIVVLVGLGQMVLGALTYLLLKVTVLDKPLKSRYAPAPATTTSMDEARTP